MNIFESPRLKLERAKSHVKSLKSLISPLSKDLYTIEIEQEFAAPFLDPIGRTLVYKPTRPIAETLGLVIGDAISNFRGALDHMASGIVRKVDPTSRPYFPMTKIWDELPSNKYWAAIDKALPGASVLFLEEIRPSGGKDEAYWCFHELDNDSKHNIILPTVAAVSINNINLSTGGMTMTNCGVGGDATMPINILRTDGAPITMQQDFNVSIDVRFPAESHLPMYDVAESLNKIAGIIGDTIDAFERLYISVKG